MGIITKTTFSNWAAPTVPIIKHRGKIRLCGDYKIRLNKFIKTNEHSIPNIEKILAKNIDIREAYMHIKVSEETSKLLTINTSKGLYKVNWLRYDMSNAPAICKDVWSQFADKFRVYKYFTII